MTGFASLAMTEGLDCHVVSLLAMTGFASLAMTSGLKSKSVIISAIKLKLPVSREIKRVFFPRKPRPAFLAKDFSSSGTASVKNFDLSKIGLSSSSSISALIFF